MGLAARVAAAPAEAPAPAKSAAGTAELFGDGLLAKGKGVEVKRSQLDDAVINWKASASARGQTLPPDALPQLERGLLDELIIRQLLLARATVLLSPDSGPVHMATLVNTPVIGLYAATRVARSGPYRSQRWCIDAYAQAARKILGSTPQQLEWTRKIEHPGVMDLISVGQVKHQLNRLLAAATLGKAA